MTDRDASGRLPAMLDPKPFEVHISDAEATDLRDRLTCTRWPDAETVDDWSQGIPLEYVREVCAYWADEYDLQAAEARFNAFPQFIADVDGMPIHFLHVRSPEPGALPLVMTHGWPGSVVEFHEVIGPLTDPVAHGGQADDAFHLVCPSLPGYGWSGKPTTSGWGVERIASTWAALMAGLLPELRGKKVVLGGIHASLRPQEAIEHVDHVVVGEAEKSWPAFVEAFKNGEAPQVMPDAGFAPMDEIPVPAAVSRIRSGEPSAIRPANTSA